MEGEETDPVIIITARAWGANHNIHSVASVGVVGAGGGGVTEDRETDR